MAKKSEDDDEQQVLGDSQFELDLPDDLKKKRSPFLFLGISVVFALLLALAVLYLTGSGPFEAPQVADTAGAVAPPPQVKPASLPATEPVALPLPKPAEPSKDTSDDAKAKKGKAAKKKAPAAKGKKKKKK